MKKVILSAFAMSLIVLGTNVSAQTESVDDFLGLESEILPDLKGPQRFTGEELHKNQSWNVSPEKAVIDLAEPNKGQGYSIIRWNEIDPEKWMNIKSWMIEREIKDANPEWKIRLREANHLELVGKILQCRGTCSVYRGINKANVQHLSRLIEGDELRTEKDSVAWVYLMDGSLMRLSSETSVSLNEFNISNSSFLILARLNHGHVFWSPRFKNEFQKDSAPETDSHSLPLLVRQANLEFFDREVYKTESSEIRLREHSELHESGIEDQLVALNRMKVENNPGFISTKVMFVAPNGTVVAKNAAFDMVHMTGGLTWFKKRSQEEGEEFNLHLRGYMATDVKTISENEWYEVESNGRSYSKMDSPLGFLQVLELLTKRIQTIEFAREFWVRDFTIPIMKAIGSPELMARDFGYKLWDFELANRFDFLLEYTRRIETTNLRSVENLLVKLENLGEKPRKEISDDLYRASLNHYLLGLKNRYDKRKLKVRELDDLQYYVWILRNGKF